MTYQLASKKFSREWRRSKKYSDKEIRWLARRRNLTVKRDHTDLIIHKPGDEAEVVARFVPLKESGPIPEVRKTLFAVLKLTAVILLTTCTLSAQTYEEKVVAAVLMGEAWCQGETGMTAVGEVIHQRSVEKSKTPLQVVLARRKSVHAFSCLNRTTADALVARFARKADYATALKIARRVCASPAELPGMTKAATHFTRADEKPAWAKGKKPVVVIGDHAFYRIRNY